MGARDSSLISQSFMGYEMKGYEKAKSKGLGVTLTRLVGRTNESQTIKPKIWDQIRGAAGAHCNPGHLTCPSPAV